MTNNSIQHQTFVYIQLKDQTVLFQSIQFSISHLFALSLNVKLVFKPYIGPYQVLPLRARVNLKAIAMKGYSALSKSPGLEPHY